MAEAKNGVQIPEVNECIATLENQGSFELVALVVPSHTKKKKPISEADQERWARDAECRLTVDQMPYTDEFEMLFQSFITQSGSTLTRNQVWRALAGVRKQSGLMRKERP